jgi:hypothetical protein
MWHASGLFAPREHLSGFRTQLCRSAEQVFSRLLRFLLGLGKAVSRIPLRSHAAGPQREPSSPFAARQITAREFSVLPRAASVEVPLADFFGSGLGQSFSYQSVMTNVAPVGGLNCYFPMPFEKSALITVFHDHEQPIPRLYFQVDYLALSEPLAGVGQFHAQYRQDGNRSNPMVKSEDTGPPTHHRQSRGAWTFRRFYVLPNGGRGRKLEICP